MTLVSEIITRAYRETNVISKDAALSPAEQAEGLPRLQTLIASVFGNEIGENLNDWPLGNFGRSQATAGLCDTRGARFPPINSRIIATAEEARTVEFPAFPSDGSRMALIDPYSRLAAFPVTLDGNGRTIEQEASLVLDADGLFRVWFYRADLGNWVRVTEIDSFSEMPFPMEFDDYFIIGVAMRTNPSAGFRIAPESVARFEQQQRQLYGRYAQIAPLDINTDLSYTSRQSYDTYWPGSSQGAWNTGRWGC